MSGIYAVAIIAVLVLIAAFWSLNRMEETF